MQQAPATSTPPPAHQQQQQQQQLQGCSSQQTHGPTARNIRPRYRHSASSPALVTIYSQKPLPALPQQAWTSPRSMTPRSHAPTSTHSTEPISSTTQISNPHSTSLAYPDRDILSPTLSTATQLSDDSHKAQRRTSTSSTATTPFNGQSNPRNSFTASSKMSRRSSHKIFQLTGLNVDGTDDHLMTSAGADSDSSSTSSSRRLEEHSTYETSDYHLVPVLEADGPESCTSRESSWGPLSPQSAALPPLNFQRPSPAETNDAKLFGGLDSSFAQMRLDDGRLRSWDSAYGQFSDMEAAGEYHEFATHLATRQSRQMSDPATTDLAALKKKRSSLSLAFSAAARFSRRRPTLNPLQDTEAASASHSARRLSMKSSASPSRSAVYKPAPPRPDPAPPLKSAWEHDSDEDSGRSLPNLREWFMQRNAEASKPLRRSQSAVPVGSGQPTKWTLQGDHSREEVIGAAERARQIQMEKAAKRREDIIRNIKTVPEGTAF